MSVIRVKVTADARKERFEETGTNMFTVSVREPAEGNMANARVRELVAAYFAISIKQVRIEAGHHSPSKRIHITFAKKGA